MKKLLFFVAAALVALPVMAQGNSDKMFMKEAKKKVKQLVAEGWKIDGSKTMEVTFFEHYKRLSAEGAFEIIGNVIGTYEGATEVKTLNQAQQWASRNAAVSYAKQAGEVLKGRTTAEIGGATDNFYEAYEGLVQKEIKGELKKSIGLYREKNGGGVEYKAFYVVDEAAASKARIRAWENLMNESEYSRKHAEQISKFIKEGFDVASE